MKVLILIILEDGFCLEAVPEIINTHVAELTGLNPYYTGRWFLLLSSHASIEKGKFVS